MMCSVLEIVVANCESCLIVCDVLQLNDAPLAIVDKRRSAHNVSEVMNLIGDVDGKVAVLVDDMIDTAGTITNAAKVCSPVVQALPFAVMALDGPELQMPRALGWSAELYMAVPLHCALLCASPRWAFTDSFSTNTPPSVHTRVQRLLVSSDPNLNLVSNCLCCVDRCCDKRVPGRSMHVPHMLCSAHQPQNG